MKKMSYTTDMTNGDVIRAMNDDELADFLISYGCGDIDTARTFCDMCGKEKNNLNCDDCVRWWVGNDCKAPQGLKYWDK